MDDVSLLKAYADRQDQEAFAQLVRRHGNWLYSAARRQLADAHLAEDVTQAVFLLLARRAGKLRRYSYLSGWLFIALGYCVRQTKQRQAATRRREQEAATMRSEAVQEASWDELAPLLERAVGRLRKADRDAVLLRFYEQRPLAEVGQLMGTSEEAAKKRVQRAVERLRATLAGEGVSVGPAGLTVVMTEKVAEAAPAGVMEGLSKVAAGGSGSTSAAAGAIAQGAAGTLALATARSMVLVGVLLLASGVSAFYCLAAAAGRYWGNSPATAAPAMSSSAQFGAQMTHEITRLRIHQVMPNPAGRHEVLLVSDWEGRSIQMIIGAEGQPLRPWTEGQGDPDASDTYSTVVRALKENGSRIDDLLLGELDDLMLSARLRVRHDGAVQEIECRPSDGLNLAVRAGCPIRIERSLVQSLYFRHPNGTPLTADEAWQWLLSLRPHPEDPMTVVHPPGPPPFPVLPPRVMKKPSPSPVPIDSASVSLDQFKPAGLRDLEQWLGTGTLLPASSLEVQCPASSPEGMVTAQIDPQRQFVLGVTEKRSSDLSMPVAVLRGAMMGDTSPRPATTTTALRVLSAAQVSIEAIAIHSDDAGETIGILVLSDGVRRTRQTMHPIEAMSLAFTAHCPVLISEKLWDKSSAGK